jgi:hypothetical protein
MEPIEAAAGPLGAETGATCGASGGEASGQPMQQARDPVRQHGGRLPPLFDPHMADASPGNNSADRTTATVIGSQRLF